MYNSHSALWKFTLVVQSTDGGRRPLIERTLGVYGINDVMRKKQEFICKYGASSVIQEMVSLK